MTKRSRARDVHGGTSFDWFTFFCANLQTGFGPFVAVYLTAEKWTQTDIGLVLMVGGLVGLFGQVPGGMMVDAVRSKAFVAGLAVAAIGIAALAMATGSLFAIILFAWVLHSAASCILSPSIATISLGLVGHERISARLGRNATFASVGSALAAAGMGACGAYFSNRAVFFVTAALAAPAIAAFVPLARVTAPAPRAAAAPPPRDRVRLSDWTRLLTNRPLIILALITALFTLSNAAMLPLVGSVLTLRAAHSPTALIAACIIVPQIMVAVLSPLVGRKAQSWGRRPLLVIGMAALPIRGYLLGVVHDPYLFVPIQMLDGISSAVLGVMIPLVAADATRRTGGGYALAQGLIGTAMGVGASFSSTIAGIITDRFGSVLAFDGLTAIAIVGFYLTWLLMPETKDETASAG